MLVMASTALALFPITPWELDSCEEFNVFPVLCCVYRWDELTRSLKRPHKTGRHLTHMGRDGANKELFQL